MADNKRPLMDEIMNAGDEARKKWEQTKKETEIKQRQSGIKK